MDAQPLEGRVFVVVGGTTGLGLSAALAIVRAGGQVVTVGRNPDSAREAQKALGSRGCTVTGDASLPETAALAIDEAISQFGGFHGLYHVAGGSGRKMGDGPLHELSDDGWAYTVNLNLTSTFNSNRAAVRQLLEQGGGGAILNMGSVLGASPASKYFGTHAYAACKAGIIGLTRASASYYAPHNIRFNVLAPALVETPMAQRAARDPEILEFIRSKQPLDGGRIGQPQDLDDAVVFFLSDASKFVTGQVLYADGGWAVTDGQYQ